jgi:hypothetical protein
VSDTWTTLDEIKFIKGLGTYGKARLNRTELLVLYIKSIENREVWDDGENMQVDKDEVVAYLKGEVKIRKGVGPRGKEYLRLNNDD